jgi:hypothetical protein
LHVTRAAQQIDRVAAWPRISPNGRALRAYLSPPPSGVFDEPSSEGRTHMLNDGYHRFAASIAVGFTQVPVIVVRSIADIKRGEGMA